MSVAYISRFDKPYFIAYIPDFLDKDDFERIKVDCASCSPKNENNTADKNRLTYISQDDICHSIIYSDKYNKFKVKSMLMCKPC